MVYLFCGKLLDWYNNTKLTNQTKHHAFTNAIQYVVKVNTSKQYWFVVPLLRPVSKIRVIGQR